MKKLCIVTPSLNRYSETFIQNQIEYLPFEKFVITTETGEFASRNSPLASKSLLAKIYRGFGRLIFNEDFKNQQQDLLKKYLIKNEIQHVLFQYGTTAKKGYQSCIDARVDYTVHFHGFDAYTYCYGHDYYNEVLRYAKNLVAVSQHMKNQLVSIGADSDKIIVIPYGTSFRPTSIEMRSKKKNRFLAIGRFVEKKAPYITILAFSEALKKNENLTLDMVGDGVLLPICQDLVKGLGIEQNIKFHGALAQRDVKNLIGQCDIFIQHSKRAKNGDSEGLPNAIIEALMMNKPVVSTYHSGIPEIVKHGKNGLLAAECDIAGTAKNILKAVDYKFKFREMQSLGLEVSITRLAKLIGG